MVITCHSIVNKSYEGVGLNFSEWKKDILNINESGVNTMSISEITHIPRPTVVRKLNYLLKNKYISVNKKKQFTINMIQVIGYDKVGNTQGSSSRPPTPLWWVGTKKKKKKKKKCLV